MLVAAVAAIIGLLGLLVAVRWLFHAEFIDLVVPGANAIGIINPLLFISCAVCIFVLGSGHSTRRTTYVVRACTAFLVIIPFLYLVENVTGVTLGIDVAHAGVGPTFGNPHPGRISPNASFGFLCAGAALCLLQVERGKNAWVGTVFWLTVATGLIGLAGVVGHVLHLEELYQVARSNRMLLATAFGLTAVAAGLWLLWEQRRQQQEQSLDGYEARIGRRSLVVLGFVTAAAGIGGFAVMRDQFEESVSKNMLLTAEMTAASLEGNLDSALALARMVATRPVVYQALGQAARDPVSSAAVKQLNKVADGILGAGVTRVRFFDPKGVLLADRGTIPQPGKQSRHPLVASGQEATLVWDRGFELAAENVVVEDGVVVGRMASEQRLPIFDKLMGALSASGDTSDALLCSRVDTQLECAPSRIYVAPYSFAMFDAAGKPAKPMSHALLGEKGSVVVPDLRGMPVFAAYVPLEGFGLGLVYKADVQTAYAPLRQRVEAVFAIVTLLVLLSMMALRSQVRPLLARIAADRRRSQSILNQSNDVFLAFGSSGLITDWNEQAQEVFGWPADEVIGKRYAEQLIPRLRLEALEASHDSGTDEVARLSRRIEATAIHRSGREFAVEISVAGLQTPDGFVATAFVRDITQRKAIEQALQSSEHRLCMITDNMPALVTYIDRAERYCFVNAHVERIFGILKESMLGRTMREIRGEGIYAEIAPHVAAALGGKSVSFQSSGDAQGKTFHYQSTYIPDVDAQGTVCGFYAMTFDITALKETQARLDALARVDGLTGLPNRRQFEERLAESMARTRRSGVPMALMFLDIDRFKQINDTLGHAGGDCVLKEFAGRLRAAVRSTDVVARLAGDEFIVLLEGVDDAALLEGIAEKVLDSIRLPLVVAKTRVQVTASVGVSTYKGGVQTPAEVLAKADKALYVSKAEGRDQAHWHQTMPAML